MDAEIIQGLEKRLETMVARFQPEKAFILTQNGPAWVPTAVHNLSRTGPWSAGVVALGALEYAAEHREAKLFADAPGLASENPMAFLSTPLHSVMVSHAWWDASRAIIVYLSRPLNNGLYTEQDLAELNRQLAAHLPSG
jgi:hypothetical protein